MRLRLGTRGSRLALIQAELMASRLSEQGHDVEVVVIVTDGDVRAPGTVAGEGVFVAAIESALLHSEIDIAVHSAKDLPLVAEPKLVIAAHPERADPRDALVTASGRHTIASLAPGARVGTDSPRRAGFLRAARHDLEIVALHGNVDSRLGRLDAGDFDAMVLAAAGLDRLGLGDRIDQRLDPVFMPPAPAQGALAVQARRVDAATVEMLGRLDDRDIRLAVEAEREVLRATGGTCRSPVGALATVTGEGFSLLLGGVNSDGSGARTDSVSGPRDHALAIAYAAGEALAGLVALR